MLDVAFLVCMGVVGGLMWGVVRCLDASGYVLKLGRAWTIAIWGLIGAAIGALLSVVFQFRTFYTPTL
jgi:hypothetical protein